MAVSSEAEQPAAAAIDTEARCSIAQDGVVVAAPGDWWTRFRSRLDAEDDDDGDGVDGGPDDVIAQAIELMTIATV